MVRIERRLRELAGRDVDLVEREMLRASVMQEIAQETVRAF